MNADRWRRKDIRRRCVKVTGSRAPGTIGLSGPQAATDAIGGGASASRVRARGGLSQRGDMLTYLG